MIKSSYSPEAIDSKVVSKVFVVRDGKEVLLLLRPEGIPHGGMWDLPGGHILVGERLLDGTVREVREESELEIEKEDLVPVYDDGALNYFFYADNWKGHFKRSHEHIDDAWIKLEDLTSYDMGPRYNKIMSKFLELYEGRDEDQVG